MNASREQQLLSLFELEELARGRTGDNWQSLLLGLTERFLSDSGSSISAYDDVYSDIVCHLLDNVELNAREEFSQRVASLERFPNRIVKRLAHDKYSVAVPVIEQSSILSDSDLIGIANIMMQDFWLAISRRKVLGVRLTDALVGREDDAVIHQIAGNPGAILSETTYRLVIEKAKKDPLLQEKVVEREDLSSANAIRLSPFLPENLKSRLKVPESTGTVGLLDSLASLTEEEVDSGPSEQELAEIELCIEQVKAGQVRADDIVTHLADQQKFHEVCLLLAGVAGLPEKSISGAILNANALPIAVMCKGMGLSQDAFEAISHLRCHKLLLPSTEVTQQVDRYMNLKQSDAAKTLAVLKARQEKENEAA